MKKVENFTKALINLHDIYMYEEPYDNVVLSGLVALYEICFEQSWKAMKEVLELNGVQEAATGSPKSIIKTAYGLKLIENEELWLLALTSRNNVAHAYNKDIAYDIVKQTKKYYVEMFEALQKNMTEHWL